MYTARKCHDWKSEFVGHKEEVDCALATLPCFRNTQGLFMRCIACPLVGEYKSIEDVVVENVEAAKHGVTHIGKEYGARHVFPVFVVPSDEEVSVYLPHTKAEEVP